MYRGVLASELSLLRPDHEVVQVEPADLDITIMRVHPRLVICSRLTEVVRQHAPASIVLYPGGSNWAILDVDGQRKEVPNPELTDLLGAVDAATSGSPTPSVA
jgi:hypothetical protein